MVYRHRRKNVGDCCKSCEIKNMVSENMNFNTTTGVSSKKDVHWRVKIPMENPTRRQQNQQKETEE